MAPNDRGHSDPFPLLFFPEGLGVPAGEHPPYDRFIPSDVQAQMVGDHPIRHSDGGVLLRSLSSLSGSPASARLPRILKD